MSLFVDIQKKFPDFELSAKLECGQGVMALLGASGCGKSLMLKCISGIEKPDSGRIVIDGETVFDSQRKINLPPQKRQTGFLFQNYALFPNMTVWNNIACVIQKSKQEKPPIVEEIIKAFYLENVQNLYPCQISGGQQQRTALARILVSDPKILMLDEPFSALDSHLKWNMEQELTSVLENFTGTTVFVSHDRDEAYRISNRIAVMNGGKIESVGEKETLFNAPQTLAAAMITGCKNISRAEKLGEFQVKAVDWDVVLNTKEPVPDHVKHVGIRAHHFELVMNRSKADAASENCYLCRASRMIDEPFERIVLFSFESHERGRSSACNENSPLLRFEISKGLPLPDLTGGFVLHVPRERILCLV